MRSRWAGVRPLVASGKNARATKDLSRKPWIDLDDRGLVTVTGGKLTTFRRMAIETLDLLPRRRVAATEAIDFVAAEGADQAVAGTSPGEMLPGNAGYTLDDVARACDEEMALDLDDALSRRLRLSFVDSAAAWRAAPAVARVMAERLGWGSAEGQLRQFRAHLEREFGLAPEELHAAVTGS